MMAKKSTPEQAAARADLSYVSDAEPGCRRRRAGRGFFYLDPEGRRLAEPDEIARIHALAIPPAWSDVWICPDPAGHIQATGRDARGRKQYRYHPAWASCRDEAKFSSLAAFGRALPRLRARIDADLRRRGLPRERVVVEAPTSCTCCGSDRIVKMGEDVTETLEVIPRQWKVIQTVREKFTCRSCEKISQPPAPFHAIPRGWAGPQLIAMVAFEKRAVVRHWSEDNGERTAPAAEPASRALCPRGCGSQPLHPG